MSETTSNGFPPVSKNVLLHEVRRYFTFVNISLLLIGLTFLELILIILPFHGLILFGGLITLSLIKFAAVIWYFMHLKWDEMFLTAIFLLGLFLASGTVVALFYLFPPGTEEAEGAAALLQSAQYLA